MIVITIITTTMTMIITMIITTIIILIHSNKHHINNNNYMRPPLVICGLFSANSLILEKKICQKWSISSQNVVFMCDFGIAVRGER